MRVRPLRTPVAGEHLLAVQPELSLFTPGHWRRRLNLFTGRSLTQAALNAEQGYRAGMLALRGLSVSPGIVSGLELDLERQMGGGGIRPPAIPPSLIQPSLIGLRPPSMTTIGLGGLVLATDVVRPPGETPPIVALRFHLNVAGGYGIAATGEDVILPRPLRVPLDELTSCGTANQLRTGGSPATPPPPGAALAPRSYGGALGALIEFARSQPASSSLPRAGIVVLQPVRLGTIGEFDPEDACEIDPESFAFEDQQVIDACRLVFYLWPEEWPLPAADERWRNRLAYEIFERERLLEPGAAMPWDAVGVPIALVGFDGLWQPMFADRGAVARAGGKPRRRSEWIPGARNRFLAQARMEQLAEQMSELDAKGVPAATLAGRFRYLPPAGLLPRDALDLGTLAGGFFPASYRVEATPVPLEQLDAALEGSAMLARFDLEVDDEVEILVPVPQVWFEPRLLEQEVIDEEFDETITRFRRARDEWLYRRRNVREKSAALVEAVTANRPVVPPLAEDPESLEPEPATPQSPPGFRAAHLSAVRSGIHQHFFEGASQTISVGAGNELFAYVYVDRENPPTQIMLQWNDGTWEHRAYWGASRIEWGNEGTVSRLQVSDEIPEPGSWVRLQVPAPDVGLGGRTISGMAFTLFDGRVAWGAAGWLHPNGGSELVEEVWFDGELPVGATPRESGDIWEWIGTADLLAPFESPFDTAVAPAATRVHRSLPRPGTHQHILHSATQTMTLAMGERLYAWVLIDPKSPPQQIMIQWQVAGNWGHRAYWGKNLIPFGVDGTNSRRARGRLPQPGRWTRLEVSPEAVGLVGATVQGVAFALFDGGAIWGPAGRLAADSGAEQAYLQDDRTLPTGAQLSAPSATEEAWVWADAPALQASPVAAPFLNLWYDPATDVFSQDERDKLLELGLERFVPFMDERLDKADDVINLGFTRMHVNNFRVRHVALGSLDASRLAISPVFAKIARAETAVAASQQVVQLARLVSGRVPVSEIRERDLGGITGTGGTGGVPPAAAPGGAVPGADIINPTDLGSHVAPPTDIRDLGLTGEAPTAPDITSDIATTPTATTITTTASGTKALSFGTAATFGNISLTGSQLVAGGLAFTGGGAFGGSVSGAGAAAGGGMLFRQRDAVERALAAGAYTTQMRTFYAAAGGTSRTQAAKEQTAAQFLPPVSPDREAQDRIAAQAPVPGITAVRSTTIAERMTPPAASEARDYGLAARTQVLESILSLEISLEGIDLTGIADADPTPATFGQPRRTGTAALTALKADAGLLAGLRTDRNPTTLDEPSFLVAGTDLAEHTIALLRKVEGRVRQYRLALDACRVALAQVKAAVANADRRLQIIATELAEARHDVAVSLALKAEEQARLDAINARRAQILAEQVKFLAYRRLRWTSTLAATPARAIDPALVEAPVPACLAQDHEPPEELQAMIDLAREAPARWFTRLRPLLERISRVEHMVATFDAAQARTRVKTFALPATRPTVLGNAVTAVFAAQHQLLTQRKQLLMQVDTARLATLNWKASQAAAEETVSVADLAEGAHRRADVARRAADEIESISRIAACLHAEFAAVLPAIRLDWAERVSQFDTPVSLRNLAGLARWNEIGYIDRRQMQAYVDWLFDRVDAQLPEAAGLINDLVRVCLLLASHAPVGQIVAGRVAKPQKATPGGRITLRPFDVARVKVGMQALLYSGAQVVARAVVDDLGAAEVSAQVLHVEAGAAQLAESMTVHFAERAALGLPQLGRAVQFGRK